MRVLLDALCAGLLVLLISTPLSAESGELQSDLSRSFKEAMAELRRDLADRYGYCGTRSEDAVASVLVEQGPGRATYLLLQALTCGDRVGALGTIENGDLEVQIVTRDDLFSFVAGLAGSKYEPVVIAEDPAWEVERSVSERPFAGEEDLLRKAKDHMRANDSVEAIRVRDDTTYHTGPRAVTLSYLEKRGVLTHYVLVSELLGSVKSGKPYVDVYLRGYEAVGGVFTEDGSPRAELIKHKPWRHLEKLPSARDFLKEMTLKKELLSGKKEKTDKSKLFVPSAAQEQRFQEVAFQGVVRELPESAPPALDAMVIAAVIPGGADKHHVYALAETPDSSHGRTSVIVARVIVRDSGERVVFDRAREAVPVKLDALLTELRDSEPLEPADDDEPEWSVEEDESSIVVPKGADESAEGRMLAAAIEMFNSDAGLRAVVAEVSALGGTTGRTNAITLGRNSHPKHPLRGSYHFLVTRTVSEIDKKKWTASPDRFVTYAALYEFFFDGRKPKVYSPSRVGKCMGAKNIE